MTRARRMVMTLVFAPKRFLDWVYQPDDPIGPSRGQAITHLIANGHGLDTSRWMRIEAEERRLRATILKSTRATAPRPTSSRTGPPRTERSRGS